MTIKNKIRTKIKNKIRFVQVAINRYMLIALDQAGNVWYATAPPVSHNLELIPSPDELITDEYIAEVNNDYN